jgi:hypothetical protein
LCLARLFDVVKGAGRHVEIPLRRHPSAASCERASALVGRARGKC